MYLRIFIVITISLVFFTCSSQNEITFKKDAIIKINNKNIEKAKINVIQGSLFDAKGDYASAIIEYQEALQSDPNAGIYYLIAKDYLNIEKYSRAAENISNAIKLEKDNISYYELLGNIFFSAFEIDSARNVYEQILKLDSTNIQAMYSLGLLYKKNKPLTSIKLFRKLVDELGPRWDILVNLIELYSNLDKSSEELNTVEDLVKLDPGNIKLKQLLAESYLRSGKIDRAISIFEELFELDPENLNIGKNLADYYAKTNNSAKALQILGAMETRIGKTPEIEMSIAMLYARTKEWDKVNSIANEIITNDSLQIEMKLEFGGFFYALSDSDVAALPTAKNIFLKLSKIINDDPRIFLYLSGISVKEGNDNEAEVNFDKFFELENKFHKTNHNSFFLTEIGRLYLAKEDFNRTIKYLEKCKLIENENILIEYYLGFSYSRIEESEKAINSFNLALRLNPANELKIDMLGQLGLLYEGMKNYAKSDSLYEIGVKLDPENHLILNNYSYSLSERSIDLDRCERMSKKALDKEPENSSYLDTYGWILYKQNKLEGAEKYIKKAVEMRDAVGGNGAVLNEHLGDVYLKMGNKEKANEYWKRALEMDPKNKSVKEKLEKKS